LVAGSRSVLARPNILDTFEILPPHTANRHDARRRWTGADRVAHEISR
jgi:hypothetical protein